MATELGTPGIGGLDEVEDALRRWQRDEAPLQLHPGDLGWYRRRGARACAAAVRTWRRRGRMLAVGLLDSPGLLRLTTAPEARHDEELARSVVEDAARPERGVLGAGTVYVEAPTGSLVQDLLAERGWRADESWTPLRRDLAEPVEDPGLRIEVAGPERARVWAAVHRSAFEGSAFTASHWHAMAGGTPFTDARCLLAYDERDTAVAAVAVWSAGPGRPGLLEPMGVHRDHRRRGHGTAVTRAAAAALRRLGASSALVCTPSARTAAVATYRAAGFRLLPERRDRRRDALPASARADRPDA
ncbi:GNAT family N-acetyltransferase [Streptomyces sp. NPDC057197]|uniref:GNAT family N-acetyltransferase n=1 Tax=Streptomyces sp. NPDC057197 TaxID=3346045 RepID=UPI00362603E0